MDRTIKFLLGALVVLTLGSIGCGEEGGSSGTGQIRFFCDLSPAAGCSIQSPENLRGVVPGGEERTFGSLPPGLYKIDLGGEEFREPWADVCAGQTTFVVYDGSVRGGTQGCPFTP